VLGVPPGAQFLRGVQVIGVSISLSRGQVSSIRVLRVGRVLPRSVLSQGDFVQVGQAGGSVVGCIPRLNQVQGVDATRCLRRVTETLHVEKNKVFLEE
jgi:hypothetical protein